MSVRKDLLKHFKLAVLFLVFFFMFAAGWDILMKILDSPYTCSSAATFSHTVLDAHTNVSDEE